MDDRTSNPSCSKSGIPWWYDFMKSPMNILFTTKLQLLQDPFAPIAFWTSALHKVASDYCNFYFLFKIPVQICFHITEVIAQGKFFTFYPHIIWIVSWHLVWNSLSIVAGNHGSNTGLTTHGVTRVTFMDQSFARIYSCPHYVLNWNKDQLNDHSGFNNLTPFVGDHSLW